MDILEQLSLWTGRLAALLVVLNFTTCFVMPWAKNKLVWRGARPGKDSKDEYGHFQFTATHKWFAWSTIVMIVLHISIVIIERV